MRVSQAPHRPATTESHHTSTINHMLRRIESLQEIEAAVDRGELRAGDVLYVPDALLGRMTPKAFADFADWLDYIGLAWRVRHEPGWTVIDLVPKHPLSG